MTGVIIFFLVIITLFGDDDFADSLRGVIGFFVLLAVLLVLFNR